jgi:hypothetical protein
VVWCPNGPGNDQALELAERHVAEGEGHIAHQREIVARLERTSPTSVTLERARELLANVEYAQSLHVADRDRLRGLILVERLQ